MSILKQWLHDCNFDDDHSNCWPFEARTATRMLPTRLIEILETTVRLVETQGISNNDETTWAALAHVWGNKQPYLTCKNLALNREGILRSSLPRTFRDAVTITRNLGIRYLWIDALCIIQDSLEDWTKEIQGMETVYNGAECVLAASRVENCDSGFLTPRKPRDFVSLGTDGKNAPFYICELIDDFRVDVLDGPLNARAWYMQEHAFARRTIFFTERQTYLECGNGIRCETMTKLSK
jgi:hypothetical protein